MAQGASPEEASKMLAIMSEAMPHEEETGGHQYAQGDHE